MKGQSAEQHEGPASLGVLMNHLIPFFVAPTGWDRVTLAPASR